MHTLFTGTGNGVWEPDSRTYIFNRKLDTEKLSALLPDTAVVLISSNKETSQQRTISVTGFFNRPWYDDNEDINDNIDTTKKDETVYFTKEWQDKLLTELHSRKYSPKTIKNYVYYNKLMCKALAKSLLYLAEVQTATKLFC